MPKLMYRILRTELCGSGLLIGDRKRYMYPTLLLVNMMTNIPLKRFIITVWAGNQPDHNKTQSNTANLTMLSQQRERVKWDDRAVGRRQDPELASPFGATKRNLISQIFGVTRDPERRQQQSLTATWTLRTCEGSGTESSND